MKTKTILNEDADIPLTTSSSAVAKRPRDASYHHIFCQVT